MMASACATFGPACGSGARCSGPEAWNRGMRAAEVKSKGESRVNSLSDLSSTLHLPLLLVLFGTSVPFSFYSVPVVSLQFGASELSGLYLYCNRPRAPVNDRGRRKNPQSGANNGGRPCAGSGQPPLTPRRLPLLRLPQVQLCPTLRRRPSRAGGLRCGTGASSRSGPGGVCYNLNASCGRS